MKKWKEMKGKLRSKMALEEGEHYRKSKLYRQ